MTAAAGLTLLLVLWGCPRREPLRSEVWSPSPWYLNGVRPDNEAQLWAPFHDLVGFHRVVAALSPAVPVGTVWRVTDRATGSA